MDNIIERDLAIKAGFNEVIFLNNEGYLTEGSISNIFLIMEHCILTPSLNCGLLDGVVRGIILKEFGTKYNIIEEKVTMKHINECKGMFITNSLMGAMWVNSIGDRKLEKSSIYEAIYEDYTKLR
jgi:4-amino-4-deoxychorismate lyase